MSAASSTVPHRPSTSPLPCRAVLVRWIGLAWSGESCCAAGLCSTYVRMFVHTYIHTYIHTVHIALPCLASPRLVAPYTCGPLYASAPTSPWDAGRWAGWLCTYTIQYNTSCLPCPTVPCRVPTADAAAATATATPATSATPVTAAAAISDRHLHPKPYLAATYLAS
jgi:hypothetical protein